MEQKVFNGLKIGYARVSTDSQNLDRQIDALEAEGIDKIITEKYTGTNSDRAGLNELKKVVRQGDTVVIESLSRLGRNTIDVLTIIQDFYSEGIAVKSLKEGIIDTSSPSGTFIATIFATISQFERDNTVSRIKEGIDSARKRGKHIGRPKVDQNKLEQALDYHAAGNHSIKEIEVLTGISKATMYREINKRKDQAVFEEESASK